MKPNSFCRFDIFGEYDQLFIFPFFSLSFSLKVSELTLGLPPSPPAATLPSHCRQSAVPGGHVSVSRSGCLSSLSPPCVCPLRPAKWPPDHRNHHRRNCRNSSPLPFISSVWTVALFSQIVIIASYISRYLARRPSPLLLSFVNSLKREEEDPRPLHERERQILDERKKRKVTTSTHNRGHFLTIGHTLWFMSCDSQQLSLSLSFPISYFSPFSASFYREINGNYCQK